jgi:cephalosporin hydroxylase
MVDRTELIALAATLASFPWSGKELVVEIGAYIGTTTVMMARVLEILGHQPTILSIDPFERCQPDNLNPQGSYGRYIENIRAQGVENRCLALAAFSVDAAPAVPERIGVLVVDGAHHYDAVHSDLELYVPKVVPGGFVFIDDYGPYYPDVIRAVDEFLPTHPEMEVIAKHYYVVLRRRADTG